MVPCKLSFVASRRQPHLVELLGLQQAGERVHELEPQVLLLQHRDLLEHAQRRLLDRQQHVCTDTCEATV